MKHLFVVNPAAGKGKALELIPEIKRAFSGRSDEFIIRVTEKPGHATDIVKTFVQEDRYRVYSVGGDGTLNEVLNGIIQSSSSLAVIPSGSGNDFVRSILPDSDMNGILHRTIDGREEPMDIARVNGRYFINISSVGFDAEVVYNAIQFKKIPGISGSLAYILGIIVTVFKYKEYNLKISIDGIAHDGNILLTAVANGKFYGGGMLAAPEAKLNDGEFDVCIINALRKYKILAFFPKFIKGRHGDMKEVSFYKGRRVQISCDSEITVNIDGEVMKLKQVDFEIIPKGVWIVKPG